MGRGRKANQTRDKGSPRMVQRRVLPGGGRATGWADGSYRVTDVKPNPNAVGQRGSETAGDKPVVERKQPRSAKGPQACAKWERTCGRRQPEAGPKQPSQRAHSLTGQVDVRRHVSGAQAHRQLRTHDVILFTVRLWSGGGRLWVVGGASCTGSLRVTVGGRWSRMCDA